MPLHLLTDQTEIDPACNRLADILQHGAESYERSVGYKGGGDEPTVNWRADLGLWVATRTETDHCWFWFGTTNPAHTNSLAISAQLTFYRQGSSRMRPGVFARDDQDETIYVLHDGRLGGGRDGIGKFAFLGAYNGPRVPVVWPNGTAFEYLTFGPLEATDLPQRIVTFVQAAETFKESVTATAGSGV